MLVFVTGVQMRGLMFLVETMRGEWCSLIDFGRSAVPGEAGAAALERLLERGLVEWNAEMTAVRAAANVVVAELVPDRG